MLATDYPFLDVMWTMVIFFVWILWFWLLFTVFADIFRRHDLSGLGKTGWIVFTILLPFLGSGFVPTESMPPALRWFAENQPFTPIMETLRGLLLGTPIGTSGPIAIAWCVGISVVGYLWAIRLYNRVPGR